MDHEANQLYDPLPLCPCLLLTGLKQLCSGFYVNSTFEMILKACFLFRGKYLTWQIQMRFPDVEKAGK